MAKEWNKWGRADLTKLQRYAGTMPAATIAKLLGRSENAVWGKARAMGIDLANIDCWFTVSDLAKATFVSHHTVKQWIFSGKLCSTSGKNGRRHYLSLPQIKYFHASYSHLPSLHQLPWSTLESRLIINKSKAPKRH